MIGKTEIDLQKFCSDNACILGLVNWDCVNE